MVEPLREGRQRGPIKKYDPDSPAFTMVPVGAPPPGVSPARKGPGKSRAPTRKPK